MIDALLEAALKSAHRRVFGIVLIELPEYTIRLSTGGEYTFVIDGQSHTFRPRDSSFGSVVNFSEITEAIATELPVFSIMMVPPSEEGFGELSQPTYQGSRVRFWYGALNEDGVSAGMPKQKWDGMIDIVKSSYALGSRAIEIEVSTEFAKLMRDAEGARLSPVWHKRFYPTETGLDYVAESEAEQPWGMAGTRATAQPTGVSTSGGGLAGGGSSAASKD